MENPKSESNNSNNNGYRLIVCLKQAIDVSQLKADPSTRKLVTAGVSRKISDFDKNALEEAVRLKEKLGGEIITVTASSEDAKTSIREALAIGADRGYLIEDEALKCSDTLSTSLILGEAIKKIGKFNLILCGEASIDGFSAQIGPRLAEILNIPIITYAKKLALEDNTIIAERVLEDRVETVNTKLPAIVTVTRAINEPRIPSLMSIMKASKKEIVTWKLSDIGLSVEVAGHQGSGIIIEDVLVPITMRKKILIVEEDPQSAAKKLVEYLVKEGIVER